MAEEKRKPQIRLSKALDTGTNNKFVARLTLQMFDLLECSLLEEGKREKIKEVLLGLMQLFLREEAWIEEFSERETDFFQKMSSQQFGVGKLPPELQTSLSELDQLARTFFLNLNLAIIQGGGEIASVILNREIQGLNGLSEMVESLSAEGKLR